jgi:hypothetical protein
VGWIHLVQNTDQWQTLLNKAINLRGSRTAGNFRGSRRTMLFKDTDPRTFIYTHKYT